MLRRFRLVVALAAAGLAAAGSGVADNMPAPLA
jgi:hypothetical protein